MLRHLFESNRIRAQFKRGDWPPELVARARSLLHEKTDNITLHCYIDVRHAIQGFDHAALEELSEIASSLEKRLSVTSLYRLQALRIEASVFNETDLNAARLNSLKRFPSVAAQLHPHSQFKSELTALANQFMQRTHPLTESLNSRKDIRRICVVGNAPTELGKNQQEKIDSADLVFRFNQANTSEEFRQAYGSRTDYWVISPSHPIEPTQLKAKNIVVSGIAPFDKASLYWQNLANIKNVLYYTFSKSAWYSLVAQLHAPPSAGLLCLATLMQWRPQHTTVESYGINLQDISVQNHYADKGKRSSRHNWPAEAAIANRLLNTNGVDWDQHLSGEGKILRIAR